MSDSTTQNSNEHAMTCMEIWGGNEAFDNAVSVPGIDAWIYSQLHGDSELRRGGMAGPHLIGDKSPYNVFMVNREARDQLALALRQLASGLMTNDEFDDEAFDTVHHRQDDPALAELATYGWLHYSDMRTYRLRGRAELSLEERKGIARAVLYLKTDQEYVHGDNLISGTILGKLWIRGCLIIVGLALGAGAFTYFALNTFLCGFLAVLVLAYFGQLLFVAVLARVHRRRWDRSASKVDETFWPYIDARALKEQFRFWPFANKGAYDAAIADPPFLCGRRLTHQSGSTRW